MLGGLHSIEGDGSIIVKFDVSGYELSVSDLDRIRLVGSESDNAVDEEDTEGGEGGVYIGQQGEVQAEYVSGSEEEEEDNEGGEGGA